MDKQLSPEVTRIFAGHIRSIIDPTYSMLQLLKNNKALARDFFETCMAIELLQTCQGKRKAPNDEFLKFIKEFMKKNEFGGEELFSHFTILFYFDKKSKLREILNSPRLSHWSAQELFAKFFNAMRKERILSEDRQDSDSTKIKGGSKKLRRIPFEQEVKGKGGKILLKEVAYDTPEKYLRDFLDSDNCNYIKKEIAERLKGIYRSTRLRNIIRVIDYHLKSKGDKITLIQMSHDLGISQKSLFYIVKSIKQDKGLNLLLKYLSKK